MFEMKGFIGIVESVDDELMLGRVRVRMINEQDTSEVATEELLWAYPIMGPTSASMALQNLEKNYPDSRVTAVGTSPTGIEVGSVVLGFYLDGAQGNMPFVVGTYAKIPGADRENLGSAKDLSNHDVSQLAREKQTLLKETHGGPLVKEPASAYAAKYPNNKTVTTKSGHAIEIDDTEGHERIHVYHKSGSYFEINEDGRLVQKVKDDSYEIVVKDKKVHVSGDVTVEIKGDASINVSGKYTLNAGQVVINTPSFDLNEA